MNHSAKRGNIWVLALVLAFLVWILNSFSKGWFGSHHGGPLGWIVLAAVVVAILLYPLPLMWMKRKAVALATRGDYDEALRISRKWLQTETYGRKFEGWIMLVAGRHSEALELLKDSVFDETGHPYLKSEYFYYYVIALMEEKKYSQAQPLLEAAVLESQKNSVYLRFSLAECLLFQNKQAERALELVEQVRGDLNRVPPPKRDRLRLAQCGVIGAWALAASGRRQEALTRLDGAFSQSDSFAKDDFAQLLNSKGVVFEALGDNGKARASFQQSLAVFPYGSIAMSAREGLAKLGERVHE